MRQTFLEYGSDENDFVFLLPTIGKPKNSKPKTNKQTSAKKNLFSHLKITH